MKQNQRFIGVIVVTVFSLVTLGLTAYKADLNADRRARFRERKAKSEAAILIGTKENDRIRAAQHAQIPIEEFQKMFGTVRELSAADTEKESGMTHVYTDELSQREFLLRFEDGRLMGYHSSQSSSEIDTGVVLETQAFKGSEGIRTILLPVAFIGWCSAVIIYFSVKQARVSVSMVMVALSIVCGLCWYLKPNYSPGLQGIASNDSLFFFVLMLLCSLGAVIITRTHYSAGEPET